MVCFGFIFFLPDHDEHTSDPEIEGLEAGCDSTWGHEDATSTLARALEFSPATPESPPSATAPSLPLSPTPSQTPGTMKLMNARELIKHVTADQQGQGQLMARDVAGAAVDCKDSVGGEAEDASCGKGQPTAPALEGRDESLPPVPQTSSASGACAALPTGEKNGPGRDTYVVAAAGGDDGGDSAPTGDAPVRRKAQYHTPSRPPPVVERDAVGNEASQQGQHQTASLAERGWFDTGYLPHLQQVHSLLHTLQLHTSTHV